MRDAAAGSGTVRLVAALCAAYTLSQFYRAANSVIAPDLMRELSLSAGELGFLTGIFFIVFAACQIPVGVVLDRYGARYTMVALLLFALAGALVFAAGQGLASLALGRVLLGIGSSALLMGPLVVLARWFPPQRFATVSALVIAIGTAGNLLATAPLGYAAASFGWRGAFLGMAAVTAFCAAAVLMLVRDAPPGHPFHHRRGESLAESWRGVLEVLKNPQLPYIFSINLTGYAAFIAVLGLWGGPYLNDVHGLDTVARGNVLLAMAVASIVGFLVYGPLDRVFNTRKWLVIAGCGGMALDLLVLALMPSPPLWQVAVQFSLLGLLNGCYVFVLAHGRSIFPERLVGRGITMLNIGTMGGAAIMQLLTGWLIGGFAMTTSESIPEDAYRAVFGLMAVLLGGATLIYAQSDDVRPRDERGA